MKIDRRSMLKLLLSTAVAEVVDVEKLLWVPKPIITVPALPVSLYGIPYHCNNGVATNVWLGFSRALMHPAQYDAYVELASGIKLKLEKDVWPVYAGEVQRKFYED